MFPNAGCHSVLKGTAGHFECTMLQLTRLKRVKGQFQNSEVIVHVCVPVD